MDPFWCFNSIVRLAENKPLSSTSVIHWSLVQANIVQAFHGALLSYYVGPFNCLAMKFPSPIYRGRIGIKGRTWTWVLPQPKESSILCFIYQWCINIYRGKIPSRTPFWFGQFGILAKHSELCFEENVKTKQNNIYVGKKRNLKI